VRLPHLRKLLTVRADGAKRELNFTRQADVPGTAPLADEAATAAEASSDIATRLVRLIVMRLPPCLEVLPSTYP
jgi:hypothetical protein